MSVLSFKDSVEGFGPALRFTVLGDGYSERRDLTTGE